MDKLKKNSKIKETMAIEDSSIFKEADFIKTDVPMLNLALSGSIDGGLGPGLTVLAGPSKTFKTNYSLVMAKAYLDKYEDGIILFYDTEFGSPSSYFKKFGIDTSRVLHTPIMNVEDIKFDIMSQLEQITKKDHVMILLDSMGNMASKKEVEDALSEKSVADMSRAKQFKSLFRMVTPYLQMNQIPFVVINHTYQSQELFSKSIVSGGCVVEGTKIKTTSGLKNIEDINVGEKVITLLDEKEVTHIWNPDTLEEGEPECYEVEFEDGYKVTCSDKHKFLIDGEWVEAKDLIVGTDSETL